MTSNLFYTYGKICALYPWEVIFTTVTMTTCLLTIDRQQSEADLPLQQHSKLPKPHEAEYNAASIIIMTIIRCIAILYSYYQLRNLRKLNSKYILIISGLFTVFSSFIFTTTLINFLQMEVTELKDALFFFLLLIDLSKTSLLAQFALSSSNQQDIKNNIAKGMSILGPTITLDMVVETLLLSVGTLSGVKRLEMLSYFACMSVIVNYIVFMTFYPACLYLILDLSRFGEKGGSLFSGIVREDHKVNPVVQRVKIIMSFGLMLVHFHSRWISADKINEDISATFSAEHNNTNVGTDVSSINEYFLKWLTLSVDHIVILILVLALTVKFIFFEDTPEIADMHEPQSCSALLASRRESLLTDTRSKEVQTFTNELELLKRQLETARAPARDYDECVTIYKADNSAKNLTDEEVMLLVSKKCIAAHQLEKIMDDPLRGVKIRRQITEKLSIDLQTLPVEDFNYGQVMGTCCENVIGYVPMPLGVVGPLLLDGKKVHVPMATTEGCLVASTNRGCRALLGNGVTSRIVADGMTRGPVVRFPSLTTASEAVAWLEDADNFILLKQKFDSTSNFARLQRIQAKIAGRYLFIRFVAKTGDAMGMNMLSKGTEKSLQFIQTLFPEMEILSLSGNFCADKKPAAVNWIEGRGKSVVCEAIIPAAIVQTVLKTTAHALVDVNISKNLIGSAIAGSIGGFNAHAANIVTAIFIATGQDPAQNIGSSNCITLMEPYGESGADLYISCTMPSLEVGTVGGGTILPAQSCCLDMLGVKGSNVETPGENASQLARIVCGTVLAGELSLMSALAAGHLVKSHLALNRKTN
ncbi:HMG Coenzyme A reductase [Carabus blaptoides fortunei]